MNPNLIYMLGTERQTDYLSGAKVRWRLKRERVETSPARAAGLDAPLTIRRSTQADLASIRRVAALDSRRPPSGPCLVGELGEEIVAAITLDSGAVVANPFVHTADAVALLRMRAAQLAMASLPAPRAAREVRVRRPAPQPE